MPLFIILSGYVFNDHEEILLFVVCMGVCLIAGIFLSGKVRDLYSCLVFSMGFALYIQGNFANIDYGVFNGEEIKWETYKGYAAADTLGWLLIIAGCVVLWRFRNEVFHNL